MSALRFVTFSCCTNFTFCQRTVSRLINRTTTSSFRGTVCFSSSIRPSSFTQDLREESPCKYRYYLTSSSHRSFTSQKNFQPTELTEAEYENLAEETLDSLCEFFEDLPETEKCDEDYDCAYGSGVLTLHLGGTNGTYVMNKQTPNKQLWLSSPLSGPKRYDYCDGQWIYTRDGSGLHYLLESEISEIMSVKINLQACRFYSK